MKLQLLMVCSQSLKKRQVARMMQERGIGVFVDLNVSAKFYKLNLIGVPLGYYSFCTRGYSDRLQYLEFEYEIAKTIAGENIDKLQFVIYGGGEEVKQFAKEHSCIYVAKIIDIKNKLKGIEKKAVLEKISDTIAFGKEYDVNHILETTEKQMYLEQVCDFAKIQLKN